MIGGASAILALPPSGAPGVAPPPQAAGDDPASGFGAVIGALGATVMAVGDAAAQGAAGGEDAAPPTTPLPADAPDVDGILGILAPATGGREQTGTTVSEGTARAANDAIPASGHETLAAPIASKAMIDPSIAGDDAGDRVGPRAVLAARLAPIARASRTAGGPLVVAAPMTGKTDSASTSVSSGKPGAEEKTDSDGDDAIAAASGAIAAPLPAPLGVASPDAGIPVTGHESGATGDQRTGRPAPIPVAAPVTAPIASDAGANMATGEKPARDATPTPPGFILPAGELAGGDSVSDPTPSSAAGAVMATRDGPDALRAPAGATDGALPPKLTARPTAGLAAIPAVAAPAYPVRPTLPQDAAASVSATAASVDGGGAKDTATPAIIPTTSQPMPIQTPANAAPPPAPLATAPALPATDMAQVVMGHHLDLARDSAWLDQLARDIVSTAASDSQLRFRLNPEHLGALHVELLRRDDGAAVRMTTESEAARSLLADAQGRLVAEARAHGMRITETSVDLTRHHGSGESGQRGGGDAQSGQFGQSNSQPRQRHVNASVTMSAVNGDRTEARAARRDLYA